MGMGRDGPELTGHNRDAGSIGDDKAIPKSDWVVSREMRS
jgi:hypothetical protein